MTPDPSTFSETTQALLWVIGTLLSASGGFIIGNKRRSSKALDEAETPANLLREELEAHIAENKLERDAFLQRLSANERDIAEIKGQIPHINQALHRIEGKIDAMLTKVHQ